jgi:hypothetical protein
MNHPNEEELIAYHDGEASQRGALAEHVAGCAECRAELERIDSVLAALSMLPVPDPGEDYGQRVWAQIAPRLPEKRAAWWRSILGTGGAESWFGPRRLVAAGAIVAFLIAAFVIGRITRPTTQVSPETSATNEDKIRERVLWLAVGEHLGRSEMILVELANTQPTDAKLKEVNISSERRRAEDLLEENRLYRQTALEQGDRALASLLDELERVLLDVAHSPREISAAQLDTIRERIETNGLLFRVRVVGKELQEREESIKSSPTPDDSGKKERNKA